MEAENKEVKHKSKIASFFDTPKVWKAFAVGVIYMVVYALVSQIVGRALKLDIPQDELLTVPSNIYRGFMLPIMITSGLLVAFSVYIGWFKALFSKQNIASSKWMWIGPIAVGLYIIAHFLSADYGESSTSVIVALLISTAFVGLTEELLTRGFVTKIVRDAGSSERKVAFVSSLIFGLMHSTNIFTGQSFSNTLVQLFITFLFGVVMYISLRVTGYLAVTIVLHWLYDASLFLQTGSISSSDISAIGPFAALATFTGMLVPLVGFFALFFIRNPKNKDSKAKA
jgi:membrane protease YdiL (CAAX protease family)